jgi:hypothetical protein
MGKSMLVGFLGGVNKWFARQRGGYYIDDATLDGVLKEVKLTGLPVQIDRNLDARDVLVVTGACTFLGIDVVDSNGEVIRPTPVIESKVRYVTREELGALLPDGWMIECQLNKYSACFGESVSFPARTSMRLAIADIRAFLAQSIAQNSTDLVNSIAAEPGFSQSVMDLGLVSSDRRASAAADAVRRT